MHKIDPESFGAFEKRAPGSQMLFSLVQNQWRIEGHKACVIKLDNSNILPNLLVRQKI